MQFDTLVALRNEKSGVVVLTPDNPGAQGFLRFEAKDDPSGGDIQYVDQSVASSPACARAIMSNVLSVDEATLSSEAAKSFGERMQAAESQRQRVEDAAAAVIDRPETRDIIGMACVGPGTRHGATCGESVNLRELGSNDVAPLCTRHASLSIEYIKTEDAYYEGDTRKVKVVWVRSQMDQRVRGDQQ